MTEQEPINDAPIGAPHRDDAATQPPPQAPFKKRGSVKNAVLLGILIVVIDILIYFFLIKPDDSHLFKAIEPLKPPSASPPTGIKKVPANSNVNQKIKTYTGENFSFSYPDNAVVFQDGERLCVTLKEWYKVDKHSDNCFGGQYVKIFTKKPTQTLKAAIQEQILTGFNTETCFVKDAERHKNEGSKEYALISFTVINNDRHDPKSMEYAKKCPAQYTETDGEAYFMTDNSTAPDKFAFFGIGQIAIPGIVEGKAWQDTFVFTNQKSRTNTDVKSAK